jgi:hypothetical protein
MLLAPNRDQPFRVAKSVAVTIFDFETKIPFGSRYYVAKSISKSVTMTVLVFGTKKPFWRPVKRFTKFLVPDQDQPFGVAKSVAVTIFDFGTKIPFWQPLLCCEIGFKNSRDDSFGFWNQETVLATIKKGC